MLSKYGLADWLSIFNIDLINDRLRAPDGELIADKSTEQRIRLALTALGPTFIKFGQLLSTRPDVIGPALAEELTQLQSNAPSDDFEDIKKIIEEDLGRPLEEIFEHFEQEPLASASIGQVHTARLKKQSSDRSASNGSAKPIDVVVKVQHVNIGDKIETDLDILSGLAQLAERIDDFKCYQPVSVVNEMSKIMRRELEFGRECSNLLQFRELFKDEKSVVIPRPVAEFCTNRVITMQQMNGTKLRTAKDKVGSHEELEAIARNGANVYLQMIFKHGFYHADPHPGNIMLMNDGSLGLIDFGMVGRISEQLREDVESMLVSIVNRDAPMLATLIKRIGNCPLDLDDSALANDIADFVGQYSTQVLSQFDMSGALNDFVAIVRRYKITLPAEASLLIKTLVTLEGTTRLLNPGFSLMSVMRPYQRMLMLRRLSPGRQMRKAQRFYMQMEQLVEELPLRVSNILEQVQTGRFDVHLVHRRLGPTVNRLVLGLMTSALFLGSSLMLSYQVPPVMFPSPGTWGIENISMLGLMGCFLSIAMGLRLMWAIRKSGNLDQPE